MVLKLHHFMDIMKLYGAGIDVFTSDLKYGHDFYMASNEIVKNHNTLVTLTDGADDICGPCRCMGKRDGLVETVWKEENEEKRSVGRLLFYAGVEKYLSSFNTCPSSQD